jgi:argininosuccinate lyase
MPQKRNPVAIEHVRAIASKALGQALGVLTSVHNTPFGDINDVEDDLQPLNFSAIADSIRAVSLLGHALEAAEFNLELLKERAESNFITVTELADDIVRRDGLPFSKAHAIVAASVREASATGGQMTHDILKAAAANVAGGPLSLSADELAEVLSARHFVAVRRIYGGPAADETRDALGELRADEARDDAWREDRRVHLDEAFRKLRDAVGAARSRGKG